MNPIPFTNQYLTLGDKFYVKTWPTPVAAPALIKFNRALADGMGLSADDLSSQDGVNIFAGNLVPGSAEPLAMAYAGHQFGNFVPQLSDGRAILLGDMAGPLYTNVLPGSRLPSYERERHGTQGDRLGRLHVVHRQLRK